MIRLMITTGVLMWCVFVIWGEPLGEDEGERLASIRALDAAKSESAAVPVLVSETTPRLAVEPAPQVTRSAVTQPELGTLPRLVGEPVLVSLIVPDERVVATNDQPLGGQQIVAPTLHIEVVREQFRVTGSRVNVRSGPSTGNRVVGTVARGDIVEETGQTSGSWVEIRNTATGLVGFMSGRFLEEL